MSAWQKAPSRGRQKFNRHRLLPRFPNLPTHPVHDLWPSMSAGHRHRWASVACTFLAWRDG